MIPLVECPVARPAIVALLAPLNELLAALLYLVAGAEAMVTESDSGLDLLLLSDAAFGLRAASGSRTLPGRTIWHGSPGAIRKGWGSRS